MHRFLSLKHTLSLSKTLAKSSTTHVLTNPIKHHFMHSSTTHSVVQNGLLTRFSHTFLRKSVADCSVLFRLSRGPRGGGGGGGPLSNVNFRFSSLDSISRVWRSWFRGVSGYDMVLGLIIVNVGVFCLWRVADRKLMAENFMVSLDNVRHGRLHTLITSAFSHIEIGHMFHNVIGLYFFGQNIGNTFGPQFLLKLYLAGALGGSVFYLVHKALMTPSQKGGFTNALDPSRTPALGASGAVNSLMLLDILLNPKGTILFEFFIPVPAILLGIYLVGSDIMRAIQGDSRISGSAHLGGAAVGALAWLRVRKGRF